MSLAVYEALTFERKMVGGRNIPWLLTVKTEDGLASYVTKFFVHHDIESIFAFDILVLNMDRRNKKPNILLGNDQYYLIDHEHTFALPTNDIEPRQLLSRYGFKDHIFHEVLNRKTKYGHKPEFGTFRELFIV